MEILSAENLQVYGVKAEDIQKSLKIECFGKSFVRESDVPKKFREKALFLSSEFLTKGKQSFVTETNFSYTVWTEVKEVKTSNNSRPKDNSRGDVSELNSRILARREVNNNVPRETSYRAIDTIEREVNNTQWNVQPYASPMVDKPISSPPATSPELQTYRGVAFSAEGKEEKKQNARNQKKVRTYRGQVY
ncbi:MAG: hypothetical protein ACXITR_14050 [Cyanobacterium sp.]